MKKPLATLYIIHGWTYTTAPWATTIAILEKKGIKVEMLNVPGLTVSSKKVWTIEEYVKWADRKIPKGAIALGHSNGGRILLNLCSEQPDKLKQLILLDAAGVYESSKKRDLTRKVSKYFGFLKKIPGVAKLWHKLTGASDYAKAPANMKKTLSNMLDSDRGLQIDKVTTPTTILWGEKDTITPPRQAEVMHAAIQGSELEMFPDWSHAPYISYPEQLAEAIFRAIQHPPVIRPVADDVVAASAALALKKAPEPVLAAKGPQSPVTPNVPTKLVLRKDAEITKGLVVSDEEGAAVKYHHKKPEIASKTTDASAVSASANLKKAQTTVTPDLHVASTSASATIKKSPKRGRVTDSTATSAALVLDKKAKTKSTAKDQPAPSIVAELAEKTTGEVGFVPLELDGVDPEQVLPSGTITSASVPKVSKIEQAKRKVRAARQTKATPKRVTSTKRATKSQSAARPRSSAQAKGQK